MTRTTLLRSALFVGALAALAHADDTAPSAAPALRVRVTGAADPTAVATAIASELGVPATVVADAAACTAPCVAVEVSADAHAAIAMVTASGTTQRAIALPTSAGDAAEVIALVVGNLARDEATDLLAALAPPTTTTADAGPVTTPDDTLGGAAPPPPAAIPPPPDVAAPAVAPAAAPAAPVADEPEAPATHFGVGLVPPLSFDRTGGKHGIAIDLVIGGRRRLAAFNVAGAASVVVDDLRGTQIAGAVAAAGRVRGTQIAGAVTAGGDVDGTQIAGAVATARRIRGAQIAGAVAIAGRDARGTQLAGAVSVAGGTVDTQVAGAVAVARVVRGAQVSGAVNVAGRVDGVQVGVVNVAGGGDGVSIGLINVVRGGRTELDATVDQGAIGNLVFRHGSRRWHNVYGVGAHLDQANLDKDVTADDVWMYGLGMGPSWQRGNTTVDLDAMAWHVIYGGDFDPPELNLLNQLRLTVGHRLGPVGVVGGAALNVLVTTDPARDRLDARPVTTPMRDGTRVQVWPTAFVGLRL